MRSTRRAKIDQGVQRALVGPVKVFDDDDPRPRPGQILEERPPDLVRTSATSDHRGGRAVQLRRDLDNRPEWSRRGQRVADAPEHARARAASAETAHERRLADTCLPRDERKSALLRTFDVIQEGGERRRLGFPLQE
jgi:hypothetical protein